MNWILLIVFLLVFGAITNIIKRIEDVQRDVNQSNKDILDAIEDLKN